jgi:Fe-S-cluster containining protein
LCCTVLRVDELRKLGGVACAALAPAGGCTIYARRPHICRGYQCLWLQGKLDLEDRPDRLGAVLDLTFEAGAPLLVIREAASGATNTNVRLRAIAERYRAAMPVRITRVADALRADAPVRTLLAGGEELLATGDTVVRRRGEREIERTRAPLLERALRRALLAWQRWRIRNYGDGDAAVRRSAP